ncbi:MAG: hypothetical protein K5659_01370 [Lachnospiraceae bacterium]|jgi:hypothetical protein|nr:hypothetical protein [Lachnospiraceae bacterium]
MISEARVKLMTRLASYEQGEGKENAEIGTYFRGDYIGLQVIKSVISATICYGIVIATMILYDSESFLSDIYKMDIVSYAKNMIIYYVIFVGGYSIITYILYSIRYRKARIKLKTYFNNLRRLQALYQKERKDRVR